MCTTTSPTWTRWSPRSNRPLPSSASRSTINRSNAPQSKMSSTHTPSAKDGATRAQMSDLEDLYREIILDHYRSPRNRGELPSPPALRIEGFNPLCGDEIVVYLAVDDGIVRD